MFLNAKLIHMLSRRFYLSFYLEYQGEYGKIQNSITDFSKHYSSDYYHYAFLILGVCYI